MPTTKRVWIYAGLIMSVIWGVMTAQKNVPEHAADAPVAGVFEGVTPCDAAKRTLPQIPPNAECDMAVWRVTFNTDSTYTLNASYGMSQPNSPNIRGGGTQVIMQGKWTAENGIIRLSTSDPKISVSFLKVSNDLLHLLDGEGKMRVGHGAWSYTLNRTGGDGAPGRSFVIPTARAEEKQSGVSMLGVFEGRTPYLDSLKAFTADLVPGRTRLKWRITLYQDPATGEPARYVSGVEGRADSQEGTWTFTRGTSGQPNAVVYQLRPKGSNKTLSFLKLDDNHLFMLDEQMNLLVGSRSWSYTLSRTR